MNKLDLNKKRKKDSLFNTAFDLFITKGTNDTTISDIVKNAGVAKGTFYLYFKDKYDLRNKLVSHKSSQLLIAACDELDKHPEITVFEEKIIFIANHIIDYLTSDKLLLKFLAKNLSWGIFKSAIVSPTTDDDLNFYDVYLDMIENSDVKFSNPEIMLFLIIELISSTIYSSVLYNEPVSIDELKPHLNDTILFIIRSHIVE